MNRSTYYYSPLPANDDLNIANEIYEIWNNSPFYGYRKITEILKRCGYKINHKRVRRLIQKIGIEAIYPKPKTSIPNTSHKIYPYLLKNIEIIRPNQVFATDITYLKL